MKREELEKVMSLQKRAYGLLMWVNQAARANPAMFSAESVEQIRTAEGCAEWINHHLNSLPREFWPEPAELVPYARLFSSFFATSFRVGEVGRRDSMRVETGLVTGAKKINDRRHKKHLERRQKEAALELKRAALSALAEEAGAVVTVAELDAMIASAELGAKVTLWTYACELKRRTEYVSQGTAVHELWLELDEKTRKRMDGEMVWKVRDELVACFQKEKV
ncbi:MAG TPA: hypothetical protein VGH19_23935 [Verrucomicrobiae bacterium]